MSNFKLHTFIIYPRLPTAFSPFLLYIFILSGCSPTGVIGGTKHLAWEYKPLGGSSYDYVYSQQYLINTENSSAINMTAYNPMESDKDWRYWNGTHTYIATYFDLGRCECP